jgi:hypothetical protein
MKAFLFLTIIFILTVFMTCNQTSQRKLDKKIQFETTDQNVTHGIPINQMQLNKKTDGNVLMIKDTNQYSKSFVNNLIELSKSYPSLILISDTLFYIDNNKMEFAEPLPTDLPLNKVVEFKADKEIGNYLIKLKRRNYTDINYELIINDSITKSGIGKLHGSFFFGVESEEDEKLGTGILLRNYLDSLNQFAQLKVEIGSGKRVVLYMTVKNYCLDRIVFRER